MSSSRQPLRVLLVTHSLSGGGAERFVSNLASHLDRSRFSPSIATAIESITYKVPADSLVSLLGYRGPASLPRTVLRLRSLLHRERPDLVLSNVLSTNCLTGAAFAGWDEAPPWIARVGNAPGEREPWLQRQWARRVYPRAWAVVANSEELATAVAASYPEVAARVRSLPNPTDFAAIDQLAAAEPAGERPPGPQLVWVGRLTPQKRPDLMLEALARVRRTMDARLSMLGDGPLLGPVRARIARLSLEGAVELPGFCDNPFPRMRQADLFVLSSDFEGLPNALIEAQGLGLPAVATACPFGPAEIVVPGETGSLVPPGDPEALAAAILEELSDPARLMARGEAARNRARSLFGLPQVLPRWQDLLEEAAG